MKQRKKAVNALRAQLADKSSVGGWCEMWAAFIPLLPDLFSVISESSARERMRVKLSKSWW
jgi:hypothetical protein